MSAACPRLGFSVTIEPLPGASETDVAAMMRDLDAILTASDLDRARAVPREGGGFVVTREGSQATDEDRSYLLAWAARWTARATIVVGALTDLNERDGLE